MLIGAALLATACASADHSWRGEFDARLEGAAGSIEESLAAIAPGASRVEVSDGYANLGRELSFKGELIEGLVAPPDCAEVQEKGLDHVKSSGLVTSEASGLQDYTPAVAKGERVSIENELRILERLERQAETCA